MYYYPHYQTSFLDASFITFLRMRVFTKKCLWSPSVLVFISVLEWLRKVFHDHLKWLDGGERSFLTIHLKSLDGHWRFLPPPNRVLWMFASHLDGDKRSCVTSPPMKWCRNWCGSQAFQDPVSYLLAKIALSSSNTPLSFCCSSLSTSAASWSNCVNT